MAKNKLSQFKLKRQVDFPIGKKYGRLTVVGKPFHFKDNITKIKVKCDCGMYREVQINHLRSGSSTSCGCSRSKSKIYGYGNLSSIYARYKNSVIKNKRGFKLSRKQFVELVNQNCHYCNAPPSNMSKTKLYKNYSLYSGIDRVNNEKGYVIGNCVPCCKVCNRMKSSMGYEDFINHIESIASNLEEAARAYDAKVKELGSEHPLNFPE